MNGASRAMERYADGDASAFSELYDEVAPRLLAYLRRATRNEAHAGDLAQQTFLHLHRARSTFRPGADVVPWAFAIARRLLIDGERKSSREELHADPPQVQIDAHGGDAFVSANELGERLRAALASLPRSQREAYELVKVDGFSHAEAAAILGSTVASVKLRVHRAQLALREAAEEERKS